ncbi:hypothetical protein SAMN04488066_1203 [Halorubrum aquaticum]|uniref:DUF3784 domain-containing protein n=1 Tax=Halorubrum aquaticum TaxID=387340 RepID=A0A1I3C858_9EURY|nr:hypothetical protein [Halorubrum aquaticum]SFH70593.1 hypothetical protein SAMN04488066_1203 [Halorubrum aquaticum]
MEPSSSPLAWLTLGFLLTIAGALIKFRGWTFLLAGYDETAAIPDDVVQDIAGNTVLRVGLAVFAIGILVSVTNPPSYLGVLVGTGIVLAVLRMIYRLNTWSPRTI